MQEMQYDTKKTKDEEIRIEGMGSIIHSQGVYFRVWAPHATGVAVIGEFNDWAGDSARMKEEGEGYWGINVPAAKAGQQYKYLVNTPSGDLHKNDPYAREIAGEQGNSVIIDPGFDWDDKDFSVADWNKLIIYEMHVGTFYRSEENKPGTFYNVIEKLDYLQQLGITGIEIMPPIEFPGGISWGYNPSHPFAIESEYGGSKGLKTLINEAHKRGIAVILDIVYNHFGPDDLDIWQFDGWNENGGGGIYFYQDWRKKTPWGDSRPDYGRKEVRQYIRDNALMWLEEYHADGLRTDAIAYVRNVSGENRPEEDLPDGWSLMQWINKEVKERFPWKIIIAEDLQINEWITKPEEEGGEGFSAQWDAAFVHPVRQVLAAADDAGRNMQAISDAISFKYNGEAFQRVIYTESHDEIANGKTRVINEISPEEQHDFFARKRSVLGAVLTFTSPGIPMIFQGQEMLEDGYFTDTRQLDWQKAATFGGIVSLYRDLMHLRTNKEELTRGLTGQQVNILYLNEEENIIAYQRTSEGGARDTTVVIINFANREHADLVLPFPENGLWKLRFNSDWKGYDEGFTGNFAYDTATLESEANEAGFFDARVNLGPYTALIFSKDE